MSSLKYMHMNQSWPQQFSYYCYGTKWIHLLTKQQLVSRLYKTYLNWVNELQFMEVVNFQDLEDYNSMLSFAWKDFEHLMQLDRNSPEFDNLMNKYLYYLESKYDSEQLFYINQPYCQEDNKLMLFDEKDFMHDPYGYYS